MSKHNAHCIHYVTTIQSSLRQGRKNIMQATKAN